MSKIKIDELIEEIDDLIIQATAERSHFYVKNVLEKCKSALTSMEFMQEVPEVKSLLEALRFYGDRKNWEPCYDTKDEDGDESYIKMPFDVSPKEGEWCAHAGKRARAELKKWDD